jgi:hypothetical protein
LVLQTYGVNGLIFCILITFTFHIVILTSGVDADKAATIIGQQIGKIVLLAKKMGFGITIENLDFRKKKASLREQGKTHAKRMSGFAFSKLKLFGYLESLIACFVFSSVPQVSEHPEDSDANLRQRHQPKPRKASIVVGARVPTPLSKTMPRRIQP